MIRAWGEEDMAAPGWYVRAFEDDSKATPYSGGGGLSSGADGVGDGPLRAVEAESEKNVEKYYCCVIALGTHRLFTNTSCYS